MTYQVTCTQLTRMGRSYPVPDSETRSWGGVVGEGRVGAKNMKSIQLPLAAIIFFLINYVLILNDRGRRSLDPLNAVTL